MYIIKHGSAAFCSSDSSNTLQIQFSFNYDWICPIVLKSYLVKDYMLIVKFRTGKGVNDDFRFSKLNLV